MSDLLFKKICEFVEKKMGKYKMTFNRDTALERDLGISGDDAVEFLLDFGKEFNVSMLNFNIQEYVSSEGDWILPAIIRFFTGRKQKKNKELKLGDLEKAITAGHLDDKVINS